MFAGYGNRRYEATLAWEGRALWHRFFRVDRQRLRELYDNTMVALRIRSAKQVPGANRMAVVFDRRLVRHIPESKAKSLRRTFFTYGHVHTRKSSWGGRRMPMESIMYKHFRKKTSAV